MAPHAGRLWQHCERSATAPCLGVNAQSTATGLWAMSQVMPRLTEWPRLPRGTTLKGWVSHPATGDTATPVAARVLPSAQTHLAGRRCPTDGGKRCHRRCPRSPAHMGLTAACAARRPWPRTWPPCRCAPCAPAAAPARRGAGCPSPPRGVEQALLLQHCRPLALHSSGQVGAPGE